MSACNECDGTGSWFDASHSANRICKTCKGTGSMTHKSATTPRVSECAAGVVFDQNDYCPECGASEEDTCGKLDGMTFKHGLRIVELERELAAMTARLAESERDGVDEKLMPWRLKELDELAEHYLETMNVHEVRALIRRLARSMQDEARREGQS